MDESAAKDKFFEMVRGLWPVAKGSVRKYLAKCTRRDCPLCKSGVKHREVWEMTYCRDGKQRSRHIPTALIGEVKQALENGRRLEVLLVEIGQEHIDELCAARTVRMRREKAEKAEKAEAVGVRRRRTEKTDS